MELGCYIVTNSSNELVNVVDLPTDQLQFRNIKYSWQLLVILCI